jgi:hypothetical protein
MAPSGGVVIVLFLGTAARDASGAEQSSIEK